MVRKETMRRGGIITIVRRSWEASPPNTDLGAYPQDYLNLIMFMFLRFF